MPKNTTGRTEFHIRTNGPGCESQDQIVISASEDLQGGLKIIQKYNNNEYDDNNNNNNNNNN
ncbi:hypothetical protein RhiirC2_758206, partial [Rhizophagus irregularis]